MLVLLVWGPQFEQHNAEVNPSSKSLPLQKGWGRWSYLSWKQKPGGAQSHLVVTYEEGCQRVQGSVLCECGVQSQARRRTEFTLTGPGLQERKNFLLAGPALPPCKRVWAETSHWSKSRRKILSLVDFMKTSVFQVCYFLKKKIIAHFNLDLILFCFTTSLLFIHLFLALFC